MRGSRATTHCPLHARKEGMGGMWICVLVSVSSGGCDV